MSHDIHSYNYKNFHRGGKRRRKCEFLIFSKITTKPTHDDGEYDDNDNNDNNNNDNNNNNVDNNNFNDVDNNNNNNNNNK